MWTRRFCNFVLHILFKTLLRLEIVGLENVPLEGSLILAITHTNFLDPALAGGVMPREVVIMSKIENFGHPFLGAGRVEMPMVAAEVIHTLADVAGSFRLTNVGGELGAVVEDRHAGVVGRVGHRASMIPLRLTVHGADYGEASYGFEVVESPPYYDSAKRFKSSSLGLTARDLTFEVRRYFQKAADDPGVIVSKIEPGSKASVAGVRPYEIITHANDQPINNVDDFERLTAESGPELRLNIKRMTQGRIVKIRMPEGEESE